MLIRDSQIDISMFSCISRLGNLRSLPASTLKVTVQGAPLSTRKTEKPQGRLILGGRSGW